MNYVIAGVIGLLAGAHISTWGMYKDSPHEGFTWPKYFRSIVVALVVALGAVPILKLDLTQAPNMVIFFGVVYVVERALVEWWKTFWREDDQSKYFIPMQFHVGGKVVENRGLRIAIGVAYGGACIGVAFGVYALQGVDLGLPPWAVVLVIGSIGGWLSAFGGAWKDAPLEGFQIFKFFRSPLIALTYAVILASMTKSYLLVVFPGLGYTIATTETYKTFFFPSSPRGKFAGMPIHFPEMLERRNTFRLLYIAIWVVLVAMIAWAFASPRVGLIPL